MERVFQAYAVRKRSSLDTLRFRLPGADRDVGMDEDVHQSRSGGFGRL